MKEFKCPVCKNNDRQGLLIEKKFADKNDSNKELRKFECNYYKKVSDDEIDKCGFTFWGTQFEHNLTDKEIANFFENGTTGTIDNLLSSKGNKFSAEILLDAETNKLTLKYANSETKELENILCPKCDSKILDTAFNYQCEGYSLNECPVNVPKTIGNKKITENIAIQILSGSTTDLFTDFKNKDNEPFSARLFLDEDTLKVSYDYYIRECPKCNTGKLNSSHKFIICSNNKYKDENSSCDFIFFKNQFGTELEIDTFIELLESGKTKKPLNFISKKGSPYMANLIYSSDFKTSLEFIDQKK